MSEFKLGDLVEFIPENFDYPDWTYRLIGHGFIDDIVEVDGYIFYNVYCGKVIKQQMKNFVEIEVTDRVFEIEKENMEKLCRKLNSK